MKKKTLYGSKIQDRISKYPDRMMDITNSYLNTPNDQTLNLKPEEMHLFPERLRTYELNLQFVKNRLLELGEEFERDVEELDRTIEDLERKIKLESAKSRRTMFDSERLRDEYRLDSLRATKKMADQSSFYLSSRLFEIDEQLRTIQVAKIFIKKAPR